MVNRNVFALVRFFVLATVLFAHWDGALAADGNCYQVIPGAKDPAVCTALAENMNKFCGSKPMVCGLRISESQNSISLPNWKEMPVVSNRGFIQRLIKGSAVQCCAHEESTANRVWREVDTHMSKYGRDGRATFHKAEVDILNRGDKVVAYKLDTGYCDAVNFGPARNESPWKESFASIEKSQSGKQYAQVETFFLPRPLAFVEFNGSQRESFPGAKNLPMTSDPFLFNGKTYFLTFSANNPVVWAYGVAKAPTSDMEINIPAQVCAIKYVGLN